MLNFIALTLRLVAAVMAITGALVASQKEIGAAEILLICVALSVLADMLKGIGGMLGNNRNEKPAVSGSDKLL